MLISPLAIENSLYQYNNTKGTEDSNLFKFYSNGYESWQSTSSILNYSEFGYFTSGEDGDTINNEDAIKMKVREVSDEGISNIVLSDLDLTKDKIIYSTCNIQANMSNTGIIVDDTSNYLYFDGKYEISDNEYTTAIRLNTKDKKYVITYIIPKKMEVLSEDIIKDYESLSFESTETSIAIKMTEIQMSGYCNKYISKLSENYKVVDYDETYNNLYAVNKFSYKGSNVKSDVALEDIEYVLNNDFLFVIQDAETEQILTLGNLCIQTN
jgi:hypothetical protein